MTMSATATATGTGDTSGTSDASVNANTDAEGSSNLAGDAGGNNNDSRQKENEQQGHKHINNGNSGHVYEVARKSGSSFFLPMQILSEPRRSAMLTLYAFCREVDDCVDETADKEQAKDKLDFWRNELNSVYSGRALQHPLSSAISQLVDSYHLKHRYFEDMFDGFEMDRSGKMLKPTLAELEQYCYRVAGCVGLLSTQIFGCNSEESRKFAVALGNALQMTNILRDIEEDGKLGRIYLPRELLARHGIEGITPENITARQKELDAVCRDLAAKAGGYFGMIEAYVLPAERRRLMPALLMGEVYHYFLQQMLLKGWSWQNGHIPALSLRKKMTLIWQVAKTKWQWAG